MNTKQIDGLRVPYGLAVHGEEEEKKVVKLLREKRTIIGRETSEFENSVSKIFRKKFGVMVNSGSSANLIAIELLNLPEGSEVITPILTFSTTVSPIILKKLVPVFVDVCESTYCINLDLLEKAITKKTRALMIPLLLGSVPNLKRILSIAKKNGLKIILDSCDTLGATYENKKVGEYADICTTSFYGSHIITAAGNGGMVLMDSSKLRDRAKTLRGWGRSSALIEESESIEKRYTAKLGKIPYDAKFLFTEMGYNFLPMEIGSAFANAQFKKLKKFQERRKANFKRLKNYFKKFENFFILPEQDAKVNTYWLSFPLTIRKNVSFTRYDIVKFLENNNIQTRPIFTGIITDQPGFSSIKTKAYKNKYPVAQEIMERGFLIGCHNGLENKHLQKIEDVFSAFLKIYK